jgi:purine-binding chemotaxis protein CheW
MATPIRIGTIPETLQFSTFFVGRFFFGIDVLHVQEVLRFEKMARVPLAAPVIEGLINLRGQIVPAIDMRRRMSLEPRAQGETPMNLVVRTDEGAVSLLVDNIGDVLQLDSGTFELPPSNLSQIARELIRRIYKLPNRLLFVLDVEKTVDVGAACKARKVS